MPPRSRQDRPRGAKLRRQVIQAADDDGAESSAVGSKQRMFQNVPVIPSVSLFSGGRLSDGGPIWPNFATRKGIRFSRRGVIADREPLLPDGPLTVMDQPCVWGGYALANFGHLIAEHVTRVLTSVTAWPDYTVLFVGKPGEGAEKAPGYFWAILEWYGLPRQRVMFVTEPLRVAELHVMPQAEELAFGEPSDDYLDLLDQLPKLRGLVPISSDILYVSRQGLLEKGKGGHAGEDYLVSRLEAKGVRVLDPGTASLMEQLALYAGAKTIVFAEGSALHGRQLLGRLKQRIVVLSRRPGKDLAIGALAKRCDRLDYVEATTRLVIAVSTDSHSYTAKGISFYDLAAVQACFRDLGVDLAAGWSQTDFVKVRDAQARAWLVAIRAKAGLPKSSLRQIRDAFQMEGIARVRTDTMWTRLKRRAKMLLTLLSGRK